jgi:hypothetical protein
MCLYDLGLTDSDIGPSSKVTILLRLIDLQTTNYSIQLLQRSARSCSAVLMQKTARKQQQQQLLLRQRQPLPCSISASERKSSTSLDHNRLLLPSCCCACRCNTSACPPRSPPRSPRRAMRLYDLSCPTLLQGNRNPGIDMSMKDFCTQYEVETGAEEKLATNSYGNARLLSFVTIQELKDMKFLPGEIASLRDAVQKWSVAP